MTLPVYGVYGVSGCGRGIMPLARNRLREMGVPFDRLVFIDDNPTARQVNGQQVCRYDEFMALPASSRHVAIPPLSR